MLGFKQFLVEVWGHDKKWQKQKLHAALAHHLAKRFGGKTSYRHLGYSTEHSVDKD